MSEETSMDKSDFFGWGFVAGVLVIGAVSLVGHFSSNDIYNNAKVYKAENGKSVIRLYREGGDQIMVGDESGTDYKTLNTYLREVQDTNDRKVERAKIEKLVRWED